MDGTTVDVSDSARACAMYGIPSLSVAANGVLPASASISRSLNDPPRFAIVRGACGSWRRDDARGTSAAGGTG